MTEGEGMDSRLGALSACLCRDGEGGYQWRSGWRAACASSRREEGVVWGAVVTISGSVSASRAMDFMASTKVSRVRLLSHSVGSIMRASGTTWGKYMVGGWKP